MPVERSDDYHYHLCYRCGRVWAHDPEHVMFGDRDKEHTCRCGARQYMKHTPDDDAGRKADSLWARRVRDRVRSAPSPR